MYQSMNKKIIPLIVFCTGYLVYLGYNKWFVKCADFTTQAEAQQHMMKYGARRLDGDHDGEACECLYGGSGYNKKICKKWRYYRRL